jgi:acyl carrier protein
MDIAEQVRTVMAKTLMLDVSQLTDNAKLVDDLGVSSLDRFELAMSLEEAFDIEMSQEDQDKITTIGEAVRYIEAKLAARG